MNSTHEKTAWTAIQAAGFHRFATEAGIIAPRRLQNNKEERQ